MSLNECGVTFCAEALLDYQRTGELRPPMGNRDPARRAAGRVPVHRQRQLGRR